MLAYIENNKQSYKELDPKIYGQLVHLPKISVIVPSFNQADFLDRTLKSVVNQNYPNLELIVIDGGSKDHSVEIIKKYESKISFWVSEKDSGQSNAINKGFAKASGDLMGWLNSDDCYNPGAFYQLAKAYNEHKNKNFFYGDALTIHVDDTVFEYWNAQLVMDRYLRFGGLIASHSAFWKPEIHQQMSEELYCNVDGELWIRMVKGSKKQYIHYPIGSYRMQPSSKSADEVWKAKWKADDEYLSNKYGPPPEKGSYLIYEYHYVQKIFHIIQKKWPVLTLPY